jgi:hypothetical protein
VSFIFVYAAAVLEDRLTAAISAVLPESLGGKAKPKENIDRLKKGKRLIEKAKTGAGMG